MKINPFSHRKVTYDQSLVDNGVELSVRHLKQYFKFGHGRGALTTKAVHDTSFDIKKGECFGLVGESGCGKTTTGRSLIRLYNITSGSVYFKGYRISAGKRWNEKEIKWKRIKIGNAIKALRKQEAEELFAARDISGIGQKFKDLDKQIKEVNLALGEAKKTYKVALKAAKESDDINHQETMIDQAKASYQSKISPLKDHRKNLYFKMREAYKEMVTANRNVVGVNKEDNRHAIEEIKRKYQVLIDEKKAELSAILKEQKEKIKQINYDNHHVDKKLMSKMQMIFQDPVDSLDPRMTVEDIIQEGLHIQGHYNMYENRKKVKEVLEKVGLLPEYASRYPHEFSGGQRQRIGIARALIMKPEFLICDEPISALDVSIRAQIINLLNDLKDEMGLTILFIAHDLSVVKYFCDRIAVMYFGQMVELATSDELFKHPLHPYTNALLSAIPKPDPLSEKKRKRYVYNPAKEHDYSKEKPKLVEILPGHFVLANSEEVEKYRKKIAKLDETK